MSTALVPLAPSLYEIEQDLQALLDTADVVSEEMEQQFLAELSEALQRSVEKRDRVAQFVTHLELLQSNCDVEIKRLQNLRRRSGLVEKRMREYVARVIESLGTDAKGKYKRLDGNTVSFSLRANPPSVDIQDEDAIPPEYKCITVTLPMDIWGALCENFSLTDIAEKAKVTISRSSIRDAIDAGQEVPGADLNIGGHTLVIR